MFSLRPHHGIIVLLLTGFLLAGTTAGAQRYPKHDRPWTGAGAYITGEREADEILAGAAIGGVVGDAIGAYMDRQQERLAHIPGTTVKRMGEDTLLVHFNSDVLFKSGAATLDSEGRSTLGQVADVINDYRKTAVVVQGHTDSVGSEESNQSLSERRAQAVATYLTDRGVAPERVTSIGFGSSAPLASNSNADGRERNRRVDVLLKAKSGPLRQG